jgi:hypothetical protein
MTTNIIPLTLIEYKVYTRMELDTTVYIVLAEQESIFQDMHIDACKPFTACTGMVDTFRSNYVNTFKL